MKKLISTAAIFLFTGCSGHQNASTTKDSASQTRRNLSGFDVSYSKIATSVAIKQDWNPNSFSIALEELNSSEWTFSPELVTRLNPNELAIKSVSIKGQGTSCYYAENDIDLASCGYSASERPAVVTFTAGQIQIDATLEGLELEVYRVTATVFGGAPQSPQITTKTEIVVKATIHSDQGSVRGQVTFQENFGGTMIR